jgi:hypothetical protein
MPKFPRIPSLLFYAEYTRVELEFEVKKSFPAEFGDKLSPGHRPKRRRDPKFLSGQDLGCAASQPSFCPVRT